MSENHARTRRRQPVWLWVLGGVLLVAAAITAALMMSNRGGSQPEPEPVMVTLPVPTPTVEPVERAAGSAFFEALPSTVLAYALTATAEAPEMVALGALEGYRFDYSDGAGTLAVLAGQWPTPEEAVAAYEQLVTGLVPQAQAPVADEAAAGEVAEEPAEGDQAAEGDETAEESPAAPATGADAIEQGTVEVDGAATGAWTLIPYADGTGSMVWTNGTVLLRADGALDALRDVYAAFPL